MIHQIIAIGIIIACIYYMPMGALGYVFGFIVGYKYTAIESWVNSKIKEAEEQQKKQQF